MFDPSGALSGFDTLLGGLGTLGVGILGISLAIMVGLKFARKVGNRST